MINIGDKVKVVKPNSIDNNSIGIVIKHDNKYMKQYKYKVKFSEYLSWYYNEEELELV